MRTSTDTTDGTRPRAVGFAIMKVLTLTSVILLPGALLAAVMGMNFRIGLFEHTVVFWIAVAAIVLVAPARATSGGWRRSPR